MSYVKYLQVDRPVRGVLRIVLDRPERRNAISLEMVEALHEAVAGCSEEAVVIGTSDRRAFCSGGDLSLGPSELKHVSGRLYELYRAMLRLDAVLVAAVDGDAVGAGAQMLLACDVRIGAPSSKISFAGVATGLALGTWGLPSLVGRGRATELCLSGRVVGGDEALRIGLLDRVAGDPGTEAIGLCETIAGAPCGIARQVKDLVRSPSSDVFERLAAEADANAHGVHVAAGSRRASRM